VGDLSAQKKKFNQFVGDRVNTLAKQKANILKQKNSALSKNSIKRSPNQGLASTVVPMS